MRLLIDEDLNQRIVRGLVRKIPDLDFKSVHELGLEGKADTEVLRVAVEQGRVVISHDVSTMPVSATHRRCRGGRSPHRCTGPRSPGARSRRSTAIGPQASPVESSNRTSAIPQNVEPRTDRHHGMKTPRRTAEVARTLPTPNDISCPSGQRENTARTSHTGGGI